MSYKSPIELFETDPFIEHLRDETDNMIYRAVVKADVKVDREELIKALEYDRGQYEKGHSDGLAYKPPVLTNYDRLISKTPEELAAWMAMQEYKKPTFDGWLPLCYHAMGPRYCHENGCKECWLEWLKSPVDGGGE